MTEVREKGVGAMRVILAAVLVSQAAAGAAPQILLRSGVAAADGLRLDGFRLPVGSSAGQIALLATTSAILRDDGGVLSVVVKTGDPLPTPLVGTFGTLSGAAIGDGGEVAFLATLDSPSAAAGLFVAGGSEITSRVLQPGPVSATGFNRPSLNPVLDLVFRSMGDLYFLPAGSVTPVVVASRASPAPGGGTFRRVGPSAALNAGGVVVFSADVRRGQSGIYTWDGTSGIAVAAQETAASPIPGATYGSFDGRDGVAINDTQIAFVAPLIGSTTAGVFLHDLAGGTTTPVARVGDPVGGEPLTGLGSGFAGLNSAGDVAFLGVFASGAKLVLASGGVLSVLTSDLGSVGNFAARLSDGDEVAWQDDGSLAHYAAGSVRRVAGRSGATPLGSGFSVLFPSINATGSVAFGVSREALYLLAGADAQPVVREGDAVAGFGTIASFGRPAFGGDALLFSAFDRDGHEVIARVDGAGATKVVGTGDPGPLGAILDLGDDRLAASVDAIAFSSTLSGGSIPAALFKVDTRSGAVKPVASVGQRAVRRARFSSFGDFAFLGRGVAFITNLDDGRTGIFLRRGRHTAPLALSGRRAPGGGKLGAFAGLATGRQGLVFSANLLASPTTTRLFAKRRGRVGKLASSADAVPGGGVVGDILSFAPAGRTVAFLASMVPGDTTPRALFAADGRILRGLLRAGDPAPDGGTIAALDAEMPLPLMGDAVLVQVELTEAPVAQALLAVPVGGP